jgi:uncharacterized protein (TIGR03067 family)
MIAMVENRRSIAFLFLLSLATTSALHGDDPPKPAGASSLDGSWQAWYTNAGAKAYEMEFANGKFHAVQGEQWYKGEILLDEEAVPARIDFTIHECECGFKGKTSTGIFRWDGDSIEIRAPQPGDPRPTEFDAESGETMRLLRR